MLVPVLKLFSVSLQCSVVNRKALVGSPFAILVGYSVFLNGVMLPSTVSQAPAFSSNIHSGELVSQIFETINHKP